MFLLVELFSLKIGDRRCTTSAMASSVVPGRFDGGGNGFCLRHFDKCAVANGWTNGSLTHYIVCISARACCHFLRIPCSGI